VRIGILAVQGSFNLHRQALQSIGAEPVEVRHSEQLHNLDGMILPGGESTTFHILLSTGDLGEALLKELRCGLPAWGTCAGAVILGRGEGRPQPRWGLIDLEVIRNAYGRQVDSFVATFDIIGLAREFPGVFIRAPRFVNLGPEVEVLAKLESEPVMARQGTVLVTAFHPELTSDRSVHRYFIERLCSGSQQGTVKSAG